MAITVTYNNINVGTVANDGTGDPLRDAFIKVNYNFSQTVATFGSIIALLPVDSSGNPIPVAPIESPHFTGDPQAPTPPAGDADFSIATTGWVATYYAPLASPVLTGDPHAPLAPLGDNDSSIATTQWVHREFAPLDSPVFIGDPQAPTPLPNDSDKSIPTTEWVWAAIATGAGGGGGGGGGGGVIVGGTISSSPGGRLTLQSFEPVMTGSVTNATTIYYTPYASNVIPLYNGTTAFLITSFNELSTLLSDAVNSPTNGITAGKLYDFFVWKDTSVTPNVMRLCHGPEWSNNTTRSAGTGITRIGGIWVNSAAIVNGPGVQLGTYVGTLYCSTTNRAQWVIGDLNTKARFHLWNAYNRVNVGCSVIDGASSWVTTSGDWALMNNNANDRVEAVSGLAEDSIDVSLTVIADIAAGDTAFSAIGFDWVLGQQATEPAIFPGVGGTNATSSLISHWTAVPAAGFHYWQALEAAAPSATFYGQLEDWWSDGITFNARM